MTASKSHFLSFMVALLLIRSLMPLGFMTDFSGKNFITICSGVHAVTIEVDKDGSPLSPSKQTSKKVTCPFALISGEKNLPPIAPFIIHAEILPANAVNLPVQKVYIPSLFLLTENISPRAPPRFS
ncbi:MAG: hypothetical protein WC043_00355 [Pseudobdellovibrionaceae bacterium]